MADESPSKSPQFADASELSSVPPPTGDGHRIWTTQELLGPGREVLIQHGEDVYRLRITRHGKLILYK